MKSTEKQHGTAEIDELLDKFEHECFMLRAEASETRAKDENVRKAYERIREESARVIAATLGRSKAKSHPYGYERDTGAYDSTRCECGCVNDISATYCNDCGGKIEIDESAEKEYYDGYSKHTVFAEKHDDGSLEFCERRYVPATLVNGILTAEQVREEQTCNLIEDGNLLHCSNCGGAAEKQLWTYWNYCPNCGAKAIK